MEGLARAAGGTRSTKCGHSGLSRAVDIVAQHCAGNSGLCSSYPPNRHATPRVERGKLERLCRYVASPAIAPERLSLDGDRPVVYELKPAFRDGAAHVLFEPLDFTARLAALVPPPRTHLRRLVVPWPGAVTLECG